MKKFPQSFKWGVATAAHQVEGNNIHSDWWEWEKLPGKVKNNEHSGIACDHWGRFEEDLELMKDLGINSYRMTIEWAKIEPRPGEIDPIALQHYRKVLKLLFDAKIEPMITLHHFTSPKWFRDQGGWEWSEAPKRFADYAKYIYREIATEVRDFVTVNEPMVHLGGGYIMGLTPPGKKSFTDLKAPLVGMIRAHALAYQALHQEARAFGRTVRVGMAHHYRIFDPKTSWNPLDRLLANQISTAFNWTILNALEVGTVVMKLPGLVSIVERIPEAKNTQDFLGINYYTRDLISMGVREGKLAPSPSTKPGRPVNDLGWEIYPKGFYRVLLEISKHIPKKPIIITENGIADRADKYRAEFIDSHLQVVERAIEKGILVEGYYHWSLMDNFEWIEGYEPRFGLYEIDYSNLARKARPSVETYKKWIQNTK